MQSEVGFHIDVVVGLIAKEVVKRVLSESGYEVHSFETLIDPLQQRIRSSQGKSETTRRFFSKPDLLVYDSEENELHLVEVKFRDRPPKEFGFSLKDMRNYLRYWPDSIVVAVTPQGHIFYAQVVDELSRQIMKSKEPYWLDINLSRRFDLLEEMFPNVRQEIIEKHESLIGRIGRLRLAEE